MTALATMPSVDATLTSRPQPAWLPGVVMTVGAGREDNALLAIEHLLQMSEEPYEIVLVLDGDDVHIPFDPRFTRVNIAKHQPGEEQPRNVGVRNLSPACTHAWFLDSDILVEPDVLRCYRQAAEQEGYGVILVGTYEWMPEGMRWPAAEIENDPRWAMFHERGQGATTGELGVALGNFGGNLVWPISEFTRIGGFHRMLHHGRCEDGELGLRAASHLIPMSLVAGARGYHMAHPVNHELAMERNRRDVPMLNSWHPWVEGKGLIVTEADGARFDFICRCGAQVNTLEMWAHEAECNGSSLILPDGTA